MAASARQGRRSLQRGGAPVRTPVEGDWLRLHRATGLAYVIGRNERGVRTRIYFGRYFADTERRTVSRDAVDRASRWVREAQVLGSSPRRDVPTKLTVSGLGERFLDHAKSYYGPESNEIELYELVLGMAIELYGAVPAANFGPLALKAVRSRMLDTDRWGRSQLNAHVGRLKRVFKWAASNELVPATVFTALATVEGLRRNKATAREPRRVLPVSDAHVERRRSRNWLSALRTSSSAHRPSSSGRS